jgi:hypothetical protein
MRVLCHADKGQHYIRLTTKPVAPSARKSAEGQTQPPHNTNIKKKRFTKTCGTVYFPCST